MKFNHTAHKKLWTWLSENPEMNKYNWPGWEWNGGIADKVVNGCFACEFCNILCGECPLLWPKVRGKLGPCHTKGGLYEKWANSKDPEIQSILALQIANLPVKEGVETE